ncbi:hypothetical protein H920_18665 [Fukomys damarensis]|uniref:Uncharacterized protein n=1 Tax=Fukomys damarensis TaxID=885580 RepID=A0A091CQQ4_FUKDA|nr:hypothetical protein H920_18665 [Fukomys damarensis]
MRTSRFPGRHSVKEDMSSACPMVELEEGSGAVATQTGATGRGNVSEGLVEMSFERDHQQLVMGNTRSYSALENLWRLMAGTNSNVATGKKISDDQAFLSGPLISGSALPFWALQAGYYIQLASPVDRALAHGWCLDKYLAM